MVTSRTYSDPQEDFVRAQLTANGIPMVMRDKSSGSARQDGDGMSDIFFLSCKFRSAKSFTLTYKDYLKDIEQARKWAKIPLWALRNEHGEDVVLLRFSDFLPLVKDLETNDS